MARFFNTTGPCDERRHYMLPAAERLPEALGLIDRGDYFVLHAPRQSGKSTALRELARKLTAEGRYTALWLTCETAEPAQDDYVTAQEAVLAALQFSANVDLPADLRPPAWPAATDAAILQTGLAAWAKASPRKLVLFFDEIDALRGESLRSVLRQLRGAFPERPAAAPWSVVLCGLRDVREYRVASGGDPDRLGTSSPFNVKVASLRLADFTAQETRDLYSQHTAETGQPFTEAAQTRAFELTQGQPWLVNALAHEILFNMKVQPPAPITEEHVEQAKERMILARATHLDSLVDKLRDPRIRKVLEPIIAGDTILSDSYDDDAAYARDLGLIALDNPLRVANPIYREVIVRVLGSMVEGNVTADPRSFVRADGTLDLDRILHEFSEFWIQHGEVLEQHLLYHEVAPQLVLMAYLQRVVNGGEFIDREYGVGRGRIDVCIRWPYKDARGNRALQREAIELKVWRKGRKAPIDEGLAQLDGYLSRLGVARGVLIVFDRRPRAPAIEKRTRFEQTTTPGGHQVTLLRA